MIFEQISEILVDALGVSAEEVTLTSNIQEDLGADSLDIVEIVMSIEDVFEVSIEEDQIQSIKTVEDLVNYINAHKE